MIKFDLSKLEFSEFELSCNQAKYKVIKLINKYLYHFIVKALRYN